MSKVISFFEKKGVKLSFRLYVEKGLSSMALGLFSSLLVGLIFVTLGEQLGNFYKNEIFDFLVVMGKLAMSLVGPAIGVSVAWGLNAPNLVIFASLTSGAMGNQLGGPTGAFVATLVGAEIGKLIYKETKVDIIITPAITMISGVIVARLVGPLVGGFMLYLGRLIEEATLWQPFLFGAFISVLVGLALTAPISSAALCIMMDISGLAAGAATVGCCAQMVGFAVVSYKDNGIGGLIAQGLGTSMLQIGNIIKKPLILIPPTCASLIMGPVSTTIFYMKNNSMGAGMGTSGLVGQIATLKTMGFTSEIFVYILLLHFICPAVISWICYKFMSLKGWIECGDYRLDI